jgi:predicted transglutaminase-like cysteine proteinase
MPIRFCYIALMLLPAVASAQFDYYRELPSRELNDGDVRFSLTTGISKFVTTENRFLESKASLRFAADRWEYNVVLRLNNQVDFELPGEPGVVDIDEDQVIFLDPNLLLHNQSYHISKPFSFFATRRFGSFDLTADLSPIFRSERLWTPIVNRLDSSTYSITTYEDIREQAEIVSGLLASTSIGPVILFGGASSLSLGHIGDADVTRSSAVPVVGAGLKGIHSWINCVTTLNEWRVQHLQQVDLPWSPGAPAFLRAQAFINDRQFSSRGGSVDLSVPVTARLQISAGFTSIWSKGRTFSSADLKNWYSSVSSPWDEDMESRLPHSSVKLGMQYDLRKEELRNPVQLMQGNFHHTDIYFAKRDYYAYNAVAGIRVRNTAADPVECQFQVEVEGGIGSYRSERLRMEPDETMDLPLYLYLADASINTPSESRRMSVTVTERGRSWELASTVITLHEPHHWDGDTKNLRFFLTPEDPAIIAASRQMLFSSVTADSSLSLQQRMFISLKQFISAIGKELRYVSDPTTTMMTDRVQFPAETRVQQAGDCEDLVVYVASCLMSVGYQCAVVDLNPGNVSRGNADGKEIGHVFLLVDTGIETEHATDLGLMDVEWAARRASDGRTTIWVPLETFMLQQGFDKAFRAGASQYFQFVISPNDLSAHSVRVIDF